jgi:hypothetical protein
MTTLGNDEVRPTESPEPATGPPSAPADVELPGGEIDGGVDDDFQLPRRRRLGALTAVLALLLAVGVGVVGGVALQKHRTPAQSTAAAGGFAALRGQFAGARGAGAGAGAGAGGGAGGAGGAAAVGTIQLVDGSKIYVTTANGGVVKVTTSDATTISRSSKAPVSALAPGETVVVQGTTNSDGTVTATAVTDGGAGAGLGVGAGAGG